MSFLYPRTVAIYRLAAEPSGTAGYGAQPYQEAQARNSTLIWATSPVYTNIPCSIQEETRGKESTTNLPGSQLVPFYRIFIPLGALAKGLLLVHDYLLDDLGAKYEVSDNYWDSLGFRALTILLEA